MFDLPLAIEQAMRDAARDATIAAARLFGLPDRYWTVVRHAGQGIAAGRTVEIVGVVAASVARNAKDRPVTALPQTTIFTADWLVVAAADADILAEDVLIGASSGRAFSVLGAPETDFAYLIGPLGPTTAPDLATATLGAGLTAGLRTGASR